MQKGDGYCQNNAYQSLYKKFLLGSIESVLVKIYEVVEKWVAVDRVGQGEIVIMPKFLVRSLFGLPHNPMTQISYPSVDSPGWVITAGDMSYGWLRQSRLCQPAAD